MSMGTFKLMLVAILAAGLTAGAGALWGAAAMNPPDATGGPVPAAAPDEKLPAKPAEAGYVSHIEFSPDGKRYCVVAGRTVRVHDAATGRVAFTIRGEGAGFTADGKTLFVMGQKVLECDPATGRVRKEHPRPKTKWGWHRVAFSPDGKRYAAHSGFDVRVYDTATGFEPVQLEGQHDPGGGLSSDGLKPPEIDSQLVWSPDGKQVVGVGVLVRTRLGGHGMGATGWEVKTGNRFYSFESGIEDGPRTAAFSPDSKAIAVGYKDHVDLWTGGLNPVKKLPTAGPVTALAFSPDGKQLAAGVRLPILNGADLAPAVVGHKTEVQLLDAATGKELKRFDGFEEVNHMAPTRLPVVALAFAPDGKKLLAGTSLPPVVPIPNDFPKTGEVKAFSLDEKAAPPEPPAAAAGPWREKAVVTDTDGPVASVAFAPDGKTFAAGVRGSPGMVAWDAKSMRMRWDFSFRMAGLPHPTAVAFSPDGAVAAGTHHDGVTLMDAATGKSRGEIQEKAAAPRAIAFGPAGERVAGRPQRRLAFTDGRAVWVKTWIDGEEPGIPISGVEPGTAKFGPLAGAPKIDGTPPAGVAYSPDGKRLVFIPNYKVDPASPFGKPDPAKATHWIAQVWGGGSGEPMMVLPHGTDPVTAVAWSPDGKLIATGGKDGRVVLWDAKTGKQVRQVGLGGRGGKSTIYSLAFHPDGKTLAAAREFDEGKNARRVGLIEVATGKLGQDLQFFTAPPVAVAFSPDGKTLIVGCGNPAADPRKLTPEQRKKAGEVRVFEHKP